jgi:phage terminase large subunit GpA-like protein
MTRLTPVKKIPSYAVIIRAIHERGCTQQEALDELDRRGLWLADQQKIQAGVACAWPRKEMK